MRYWTLASRTWTELHRMRPRVLVVQNPSIVLTSLAVLWRPLMGYRLVVDAHNEAIRPHIHDCLLVRHLSRWLLRAADLTIVTNDALADTVIQARGHPMVLHDRIPEVGSFPPPAIGSRLRAAIISTFAPDEPLGEIFEAARLCPDIDFFATGRHERASRELIERKPPNVHLTEFLPEAEYWDLLRSVHVVVDLTAMPDCLVCGAYEAVAVGRPLLLTDAPAARALFAQAACFTSNEKLNIAAALLRLREGYASYASATIEVRNRVTLSWEALAGELVKRLMPWLE
jgi:glycosyltransferase involved in cell wall biosynthesis